MLEGVGMPLVYSTGAAGGREQRRPMWTQHEKAVLRLLMRQYAGVTEFDPPDVHKHPIRNEMWRLLTARYNAHPHVRSRDTKQLRKAWENLKYRARKLGSESQRSGRQQNNNESNWPLDGVTLPGPPTSPPANTTPASRETGEAGEWRCSEEDSQKNDEDLEESEKKCKDEIEEENSQNNDNPNIHQICDRETAVLNLHPIVSSLLGGGLGSLATTLPFLASPPSSQLATGLLLPHAISNLGSTGENDICQSALRSSMDSVSTTSTSPTTATSTPLPTATTSGISTSTSGTSITISNVSQANNDTLTITTSASSTTPDKLKSAEDPGNSCAAQERLQQRVSIVEGNMRHAEEQHQAQLQLLRLQMAQAIAEHDAKMRVLAAQLEYWQRRLRVQQRVSYALSAITQSDPDMEDEQIP